MEESEKEGKFEYSDIFAYVNDSKYPSEFTKDEKMQQGVTDCGVFAIAFAYHTARGDDLSKIIIKFPSGENAATPSEKRSVLNHVHTLHLKNHTHKVSSHI